MATTNITELCRQVLNDFPTCMTAVEVRDEMIKRGFNFEHYSNPLRTLHSILVRVGIRTKTVKSYGRPRAAYYHLPKPPTKSVLD